MGILVLFGIIAIMVIVWLVARRVQRDRVRSSREREALAAVTRTAEEDVTRFGEELQRLDVDLSGAATNEATRQDYQRALDCYDDAKTAIAALQSADQIRHVTSVLEDGRYAIACVHARVGGLPLPLRRPPCFFNPSHGPSTQDVPWAPAGAVTRDIPVCAADADRLAAGAEPDVRTVMIGPSRVPYWRGGPAYAPWVQGYYGNSAFSGMLPAFMLGSLLSGGFDGWGSFDSGYDAGYDSGYDSGYDAGEGGGGDTGGDSSGDGSGDYAGGDGIGGGDFDGDDGGGFDGGGFDGGGFDGGGFDGF
jgi:uncharacterized membrane protein YgcG